MVCICWSVRSYMSISLGFLPSFFGPSHFSVPFIAAFYHSGVWASVESGLTKWFIVLKAKPANVFSSSSKQSFSQPFLCLCLPLPLYVAPLYHNEGYLDGSIYQNRYRLIQKPSGFTSSSVCIGFPFVSFSCMEMLVALYVFGSLSARALSVWECSKPFGTWVV
jgi:hypothetical protein